MDNVFQINDDFNFDQILLDNPISLVGGSYMTKLLINNGSKNLYLQLPKVNTKQGFIKSSNKTYCDLMFNSSNKDVIAWFEQLEKICQTLILKKKELWFHNEVNDNDIEEMMNPIIRSYKSGKYFLVRTYLKNNKCNIFNENEQQIELNTLTKDDEIIPLINLEGIRFNSKSIHIEIILTQVMVLIQPTEFEKQCLIKLSNKQNDDENLQLNLEDSLEDNLEKDLREDIVEKKDLKEDLVEEKDLKKDIVEEKDLKEDIVEEKDLKEVIVDLDNLNNKDDIITLKDPLDVYKEIYLTAKKKALDLRNNALNAYLELNKIKNKYSLHDLDDSDDEYKEELINLSKNNL